MHVHDDDLTLYAESVFEATFPLQLRNAFSGLLLSLFLIDWTVFAYSADDPMQLLVIAGHPEELPQNRMVSERDLAIMMKPQSAMDVIAEVLLEHPELEEWYQSLGLFKTLEQLTASGDIVALWWQLGLAQALLPSNGLGRVRRAYKFLLERYTLLSVEEGCEESFLDLLEMSMYTWRGDAIAGRYLHSATDIDALEKLAETAKDYCPPPEPESNN